MVWSTFKSYYHTPDAVAWAAWDPEVKHRSAKQASPDEIVDIRQAAVKYRPPSSVIIGLDKIVTKEVYEHLIAEELNVFYLEMHGFEILKNSTTRVVFHQDFPDWLIKVCRNETRALPMESTVKAINARRNKRTGDVWLPLRNTNLLRAAGREFFVSQLEDLDADVKKHFDFPEEYLYCPMHAKASAPDHQKYFSISKKKDVYTGEETIEFIKDLKVKTQRKLAQKIIAFIKKTRMHDLHASNLVLCKTAAHWCFQIIDTEPIGILIDSNDTGAHLFDPQEHVLLSLISFRDSYCRSNNLTAMAEEVDQAIVDFVKEHEDIEVAANIKTETVFYNSAPATSFQTGCLVFLIIASIICPIIPLILLIIAVFSNCCCPSEPTDQFDAIHQNTPGIRYANQRV